METKNRLNKNDEDFDTIKTFREIKENISKDIWGLSYENFIKYIENTKHRVIRNTTEMITTS